MTSAQAHEALEGVKRELIAARTALSHLIRTVQGDPSTLTDVANDTSLRALLVTAGRLELTYTLRLFAEFEGVLMSRWSARRTTRPPMEVLIQRIASLERMSATVEFDAHRVRGYRNRIVHQGARTAELTFDECKSFLGHYVALLPVRW